jgi:ABC-type nitrate/sulfonate/bicarbonate transport system substrate-binding protein
MQEGSRVRSRRRSAVALAAAVALALVGTLAACGSDDDDNGDSGGGGGGGSAQEMEQLTLASAGVVAESSQPFVAQAKGYFEDAGVEVTFMDNVGSNVPTVISSGQADLVQSGLGSALVLTAQGRPNTVIFNSLSGTGSSVMGAPGVTKLDQLRNQRVASMAAKGTTTYGSAAFYNEKYDLNMDLVPFADPAVGAAALASGQVKGAVGDAGYYAEAVDQGKANYIKDTRDPEVREEFIGPDVGDAGYFGLTENLEEKREAVTRFMTAILRAGEYMDEASNEQLATDLRTLEVFQTIPQDQLEQLVERARGHWTMIPPGDGSISADDWQATLDRIQFWGLEGFDKDDSQFAYDEMVDMSYFEEAQKRASEE